jgi:hypothetical protein
MEVVEADPDLLEIIDAVRPSGGLAGLLNGGEQKTGERSDDCNHDKQFDECRAPGGPGGTKLSGRPAA